MSTVFVASDHHFRHSKIWQFRDAEGQRIRPWAETMEEGDEMMIDAWNRTIKKNDTVLHLGDLVIHRTGFALLPRLNGKIVLVRGNHDIFKLQDYLPHVCDIRGTHKKDTLIVSHYPVHPDSLPVWCRGNLHGHTHQNHVLLPDGTRDPRYRNLCVEVAGIEPLAFEALRDAM